MLKRHRDYKSTLSTEIDDSGYDGNSTGQHKFRKEKHPSNKRKTNSKHDSKNPKIKRQKNIHVSDSYEDQKEFVATINDTEVRLIKKTILNPKVKKRKNKIPFFDLSKSKDITAFEKVKRKHIPNYQYDRNFNAGTNLQLFIAPVFVLDENYQQFGVFTKLNIPKGEEIIAVYAGQHTITDDDENEDSKAVFQLINRKGQRIGSIDGEKNGDWTSMINGGQNPNLYVSQEIINGEPQVCFKVVKEIIAGQQCIIDYGDPYRNRLDKNFRNIHPDDNWHSPSEIYADKKYNHYYAHGLFCFDENFCRDWMLNPTHLWVIPRLFIYIIQNDINALSQLLETGCPPDLLAYACDEETFLPSSEQQHLTALMLACYLNRDECLDILLEYGADSDRCMLTNGLSPFVLLLKSPASNERMHNIAFRLLPIMDFPFVTDNNELTLLHYCIKRNNTTLAKELLRIAKEEDEDFYDKMFSKKESSNLSHADLDYCIINEQYEMLKLLLLDMFERKILIKHFNLLQIFKEETLQLLTLEKQFKLYSFLNNDHQLKEQKILLLNAVKTYLLILMGKKPWVTEKISPDKEIELLWRLINQSKNMEKIILFLNNINPVHLFTKCITSRLALNAKTSPLEFALEERPEISTYITDVMEDYLERVDNNTALILLKKYDLFSCISLAIENNNTEVYETLIGFLLKYDPAKNLTTLLLSQYIENFLPTPICRSVLQKIFADLAQNKIDISSEQKTHLLLSFINFCKAHEENLKSLNDDCILILKLISNNFPAKKQSEHNQALIVGLEYNLPIEILEGLLGEGDINGQDNRECCPLHIALKNESEAQVTFLLTHGAKVTPAIVRYAQQINVRYDTIKLLSKNIVPPLRCYPRMWNTSSPDSKHEHKDKIEQQNNHSEQQLFIPKYV